MKRVLIVSGYGVFGGLVANGLAGEAAIRLVIGDRSADRAQAFAATLAAANAHDRAGKVNFASMQSTLGQALYRHYGVHPDASYLYIEGGRAYTASRGYLEMARLPGGFHHLFRVAEILPESFRDWIYDKIALNRYGWFGKTEYCARLTEEQRRRLIAA
jgi:predicted DCC family thiol-disulfide oxidoreductase YuxK